MANNHKRVHWLIGRGASIDCKLEWDEAWRYCALPRWRRIAHLQQKIRQQMLLPTIDTTSYKNLLNNLSARMPKGVDHIFATTNWDYLLQQEVDLSMSGFSVQPPWIANSWVTHMNGSAERVADDSKRSPFLLVSDDKSQRKPSIEAETMYSSMCWGRYFVVVGMRWECETDKFLIEALGRVEDELVVGESIWIIVNPEQSILQRTEQLIKKYLPSATVVSVCHRFGDWIQQGLAELQRYQLIR